MTGMEQQEASSTNRRQGPLWEMLAGRRSPSPVAQLLDAKFLKVDPEQGESAVEFRGKPEFANPAGDIQGGMLAAMLDLAMGVSLAGTFLEGERAVTVEMKVNFIRPAKMGTLVSTGRVIRKGRSLAFLEGDVRDGAGELVATGSATAHIRPKQ